MRASTTIPMAMRSSGVLGPRSCGGGGAWGGYHLSDDESDADGDYDCDYDTYADGIDDYHTDGGAGGWGPGGVEVE